MSRKDLTEGLGVRAKIVMVVMVIHGSIMPRNDLQFESNEQKRGWLMPVVHRFGGCYVHFLVLDARFEERLLLG